jgi:hypothetical protein
MTAFSLNWTRNEARNSTVLKRAVMVLGMALAGPVLATDGLEPLASFLETNGIKVDRATAFQAATEAFLKAVDPGARFCTADEAAALRAEGPGITTGLVATALLPTLEAVELWPEELAYVKVRGLRKGGGTELLSHLKGLSNQAGIIVDLRGTDGSDLDAVVELVSPFSCPGEALFTIQDSRGATLATRTAAERPPLKAAIMVLTDRETRGAAETLAALWQGCPGIMLIGTATRGDSRVRDILTLPDGRLLYVVTHRVVPVQGGDYEGRGVVPDVEVTTPVVAGGTPLQETRVSNNPVSAKSIQDRELMIRVDGDAVLRRATDVLLGLRALNGYGHR